MTLISVSRGARDGDSASATLTAPAESEQALLGRYVAFLTPVFSIVAGWLAGVVAQYLPGVTLDQNQTVTFMVAAATVALGSAYKWMVGWQQHERLVAEGRVPARKTGPPPRTATAPEDGDSTAALLTRLVAALEVAERQAKSDAAPANVRDQLLGGSSQ